VSAQQLYACSAAGYAGNLNLFANPAGGGPFLGTPQANPAPFTGAGVGLFDAGAPWGLPEYALLGVGLYAAFGVVSSLMKEKRRRGVMRRMDF
jgi:hypothetical protein